MTVPARGAGIWFIVFIASMIRSVSPALTVLPTSIKGLAPGSGAAYAVPTIGEMTTPGCFEGSIGLTAASAGACGGATSTRTAAGAAVAFAPRATRTRRPSCSSSISVRPVSSKSFVSSWMRSWSTIDLGDLPIRRSIFLFSADQGREAGDGQHIAVDAETGDHCLCRLGNIRIVPEGFALVDVCDVDFDRRHRRLHRK